MIPLQVSAAKIPTGNVERSSSYTSATENNRSTGRPPSTIESLLDEEIRQVTHDKYLLPEQLIQRRRKAEAAAATWWLDKQPLDAFIRRATTAL